MGKEDYKFAYVSSIGNVGLENMELVIKKLYGLVANYPKESFDERIVLLLLKELEK